MYIPKSHRGLSESASLAFAQKYSFAAVASIIDDKIEVVHIPIEFSSRNDKLYLSGHIAKGNKLTNAILSGAEVTCIFSEPHAYISSSWYDHINVPTWNYIAVHIKGRFRKVEGKELFDALTQMVDHYETGRADRYRMSDMPEDMLTAHLNGLTGFEIDIQR